MIPKPIITATTTLTTTTTNCPTSPGAGFGAGTGAGALATSNNSILLTLGCQINNPLNNQIGQKNYSPVILGLASLILEGRPISEDEYQNQYPINNAEATTATTTKAAAAAAGAQVSNEHVSGGGGGGGGGGSGIANLPTAKNLAIGSGAAGIGIGGSGGGGGRQSPSRPSTSRAAALSACSGRAINITANPYAFASANYYAAASGGGGSTLATATSTAMAAMPALSPPYQPFYSHNNNSNNTFTAATSSSSSKTTSGGSASTSPDSKHQRWAQKLVQLRKISPAAQNITAEPELVALAVNDNAPYMHNFYAQPEPHQQQHQQPQQQQQQQQQHHIRPQQHKRQQQQHKRNDDLLCCSTQATNENYGGGGEYEIVRRVMLNRANIPNMPMSMPMESTNTAKNQEHLTILPTIFGDASMSSIPVATSYSSNNSNNSPSSSSSNSNSSPDKILQTLQTLATTCLRGSNSNSNSNNNINHNYNAAATANSNSNSNSTIQNIAMDLSTSPQLKSPTYSRDRSELLRTPSPLLSSSLSPKYAIELSGKRSSRLSKTMTATAELKTITEAATAINTQVFGEKSNNSNSNGSTTAKTTTTTTTINNKQRKCPKVGPHCDQFLRKLGLTKVESHDFEEHFCDMSYVNVACSRWRAYCTKIEAIIEHNQPVCIEVYLGPERHKILLEQWIISGKEKMSPPTMTLLSLCSAIRSQLYFSQIVAWRELLKTNDDSIYESGRVIHSNMQSTAAGDLAITATNGAAMNDTALHNTRGPRLNIFYRIKTYDATAAFTNKPNVHNFPNIKVSENFNISVCVKSLPRINGSLPPISNDNHKTLLSTTPPTTMTIHNASTPTNNGTLCATTPTGLAARSVAHNTQENGRSHIETAAIAAATSVAATTTTSDIINVKTNTNCDRNEELSASANGNRNQISHVCTTSILEMIDYIGNASDITDDVAACNKTLTHREKQLQKYRKRMERRDKIRDRNSFTSPEYSNNEDSKSVESAATYANGKAQPKCVDMAMDTTTITTTTAFNIENNANTNNKNSNNNSNSNGDAISNYPLKISASTQTPSTICCQNCGSEKRLICVRCDCDDDMPIKMDDDDDGDGDDDADGNGDNDDGDINYLSNNSNRKVTGAPCSQAEMLLQAIQRTPKNNKNKIKLLRQSSEAEVRQGQQNDLKHQKVFSLNRNNNNNNSNGSSRFMHAGGNNCHTCKRQKTQHVYRNGGSSLNETKPSTLTSNTGNGITPQMKQSPPLLLFQDKSSDLVGVSNGASGCADSVGAGDDENVNEDDKKTHGNLEVLQHMEHEQSYYDSETQFKTPTRLKQTPRSIAETQHPKNLISKPNNLRISCSFAELNYGSSSPTNCLATQQQQRLASNGGGRRLMPKVNLTPIFCNDANMSATKLGARSAPITYVGDPTPLAFSFENATANGYNHTQSHSTVAAVVDDESVIASLRVQKSYSAPTLPNSLSLSPRFAKQAAFHKRRSRHLSERSDRSSLCSDEQLSDEDFDSYSMQSPAGSPLKMRTRLLSQFQRRPMLGNLEESLIQKRLAPSTEAVGFRLLLSASGSFCPTQLNKPAMAYFYELRGNTLSTPYLCETRLPRKGYCVPAQGNVQATLLNPEGSVVRMFVIPYDMRDMPPWHQTFVRQRILAAVAKKQSSSQEQSKIVTTTKHGAALAAKAVAATSGSVDATSTMAAGGEQRRLGLFLSIDEMKRLRYSIHLRFQTSRSGRLMLHSDVRLLISRRTDCDTAAAYAKNMLESPNELVIDTMMPLEPKYSARPENPNKI